MTRQQSLLSVLAVVVVVAAWWFVFMAPRNEAIAALRDEVEVARTQQATVRARIRALEAVRTAAPDIEAELASARTLLPRSASLPSALRQLQDAADSSGLVLDAVAPTRPVPHADRDDLQSFTVSVAVSGGYYQWVDFVRRVEDPSLVGRGVLVEALDVTPLEYPLLAGNVQLRMFASGAVSPGVDDAATDQEENQ